MGSLDPQPKIHVAIAGGGIAGLCLARGLLQYDHLDVQVYEATAAYRDIGAGLTLHHNAITAMDLIDPAIKQAYFRKANSMAADDEKEMSTQVIMVEGKHKGEVIAHLGRAKGRKTVARKDLLQGYCALVPSDRLHMGKRLVKIEGDGPVTLTFKDGSSVRADCLIGSDGIHSHTRKHLLGDHPAVHPVNRERWYRISRDVPTEEAIQELSDKFLGYVPILCSSKAVFNIMPIHYGADLSITCAMRAKTDEEIGSTPSRDFFQGCDEDIVKMFDLIMRDLQPENIWQIYDHDPAPFYAKGNIVMVGDAAHATGPWIGNGAAQAIEDSAALHAIFAHVQDKKQVPAALLAFDEVRRPRSQKVTEFGRQMGSMYVYDFGDAWTPDSDIEDLRKYCKTIGSFTNDADVALQNQQAVAAFKKLSGSHKG